MKEAPFSTVKLAVAPAVIISLKFDQEFVFTSNIEPEFKVMLPQGFILEPENFKCVGPFRVRLPSIPQTLLPATAFTVAYAPLPSSVVVITTVSPAAGKRPADVPSISQMDVVDHATSSPEVKFVEISAQ